jgi:two-component SAPR family response regulator
MLNTNRSSHSKGMPETSEFLLKPLPTLWPSSKDNLFAIDESKSRGQDDKKNNLAVESLSIWPTIANLLKTEQYDPAAELLLKSKLAGQSIGSEANVAFLMQAREVCLIYHQYQAEITHHQQALEAANRCVHELSQQLYTMFAHLEERLRSGKENAGVALWTVTRESGPDHKQSERMSSPLKICCLGPFQVYLNGQPISEWSSLKARSIFKYLVAHPETPISKDVLMDVFWPDADPEGARHSLHQAIYSLKKILKQGSNVRSPILFEQESYFLNPDLNPWLDYIEFEKQVQSGQRLEKAGYLAEALVIYRNATKLYRGDFLLEERYEDWSVMPRREYLRQLYIDLMGQLSETALQQGEFGETTALCQKILIQDNCHEATHRRLMGCYLLQGQEHLAIRQYLFCVHNLKAELDVSPSPATQLLYEQIVGAQ